MAAGCVGLIGIFGAALGLVGFLFDRVEASETTTLQLETQEMIAASNLEMQRQNERLYEALAQTEALVEKADAISAIENQTTASPECLKAVREFEAATPEINRQLAFQRERQREMNLLRADLAPRVEMLEEASNVLKKEPSIALVEMVQRQADLTEEKAILLDQLATVQIESNLKLSTTVDAFDANLQACE